MQAANAQTSLRIQKIISPITANCPLTHRRYVDELHEGSCIGPDKEVLFA